MAVGKQNMMIDESSIRMLLSTVEAEIVLKLSQRGELSPQTLAEELGKSTNQINVTLSRLRAKGLVKRTGTEDGVTRPRYTYTVDQEASQDLINSFRRSDEAPEAANNRIQTYENRVRRSIESEKLHKLESERAADDFYYKAMESIEDKQTASEFMKQSVKYTRISKRAYDEMGDQENVNRMLLSEGERNFLLSSMTDDKTLLTKVHEICKSLIANATNNIHKQKAAEIMQRSMLVSTLGSRIDGQEIAILHDIKSELDKRDDVQHGLKDAFGELVDRLTINDAPSVRENDFPKLTKFMSESSTSNT